MKKLLVIVGIMAVVGLFFHFACSKESRNEAIDRLVKAGKVLNGELHPADVEYGVPNIVAEQQRKELIRQNTSWTAENRALHPVEYCQAQLIELEKFANRLEVTAHEVATKKAEVARMMTWNEGRLKMVSQFLREAKAMYRECEAKNSWPAKLGGFSLSRERTRGKIVESAQKIQQLQTRVGSQRNQLTHLKKKSELVLEEQKQLVTLRERIEVTISDLKLMKVIVSEKGVADALNAINDAMGSLGADYDNPDLDDILAPESTSSLSLNFDKIMSE